MYQPTVNGLVGYYGEEVKRNTDVELWEDEQPLKRQRSTLVEIEENRRPNRAKECCKKTIIGIDRVFRCCPVEAQQQSERSFWSGDVYNPMHFSCIFMSGGVISMIIWSCMTSLTVVELKSVEYDKLDGCSQIQNKNYSDSDVYPGLCSFNLTVGEEMNPPIYVYYELNNFWQNNMEYRKAFSWQQLLGVSANNTDFCWDIKRYDDLNIYPCGNIAYSFFADRFEMTDLTEGYDFCSACSSPGEENSWADVWAEWSSEPDWSGTNIAWETDRKNIFLGASGDVRGVSKEGWRQAEIYGIPLPDVTNEDLMVWMRVAALPKFIKPFRVIRSRSLSVGTTLQITAHAFFDIGYPGSYKKVILRSTNTPKSNAWGFAKKMGSESVLLNSMYLVAAIYLLVVGLVALCLELFPMKKYERQNDGDVAEDKTATFGVAEA